MAIISERNTWINYNDPIVTYIISFELASTDLAEFLYGFSLDFIEISSNTKMFVASPVETEQDKEDAKNDFIKIFEKGRRERQMLLSFASKERFPVKQKVSKTPFLNYMYYFDANGKIKGDYVYNMQNYLRKYTVIPSCTTFSEVMKKNKKLDLSFSYLPFACSVIWKEFNLSDLKSATLQFKLFFEMYTDIWFDTSKFHRVWNEEDLEYDVGFASNEILAYRNTPRLNSFLRDLRKTVDKYGGDWEMESEGNAIEYIIGLEKNESYADKFNDHSIALNGKIIYQEDVDEGRVKMPPFGVICGG